MSAVYKLRSHKLDNFIVTKFDDDFNIESYYEMTISDGVVHCGCPAGARPSCRHRQMFTQLLERLDTAWFLDFDTRQWVDPTGEAKEATYELNSISEGPQGSLGSSFTPLGTTGYGETKSAGPIPADAVIVDNLSALFEPHSTTVSAADFESADEGSNPSVAAKPVDVHPFRRRM